MSAADDAGPAAGGADLKSGAGSDEGRLLAIPAKHLATLRNLRRILSYSTRLDQWVLAGSLLSTVAAGLAMPLMNILFGQLVGVFTGFFTPGIEETEDEFLQAVDECVLYIVYLFIAKLVLSYFSNLGFRMTSMRISATIRLVYLRSLFSLPISTLDMIPPGQTAAIITVTASTLQLGISEKISNLFSSVTAVVAALVIAFAYNWLLTLATSTGLMFIALVYGLTSPTIARVMTELQEAEIQAASVATEAFTSARMVAACGAESKMFERYAHLVDKTRLGGARMARFVAAQQGLIFFGIYGTFALAFWWAFEMYIMVAITSSESLIVVLLSVMLMASSIGQITGPLSAASQAADACAIFHTIIDAPKPTYGTAKGDGVSADGDIVFENVNFTYATRPDVKILDNLNLRIPAGKVTAIVGPSGSGKSTIVGILQRWYEFNGDMTTNQLVLWLRNGLVSVAGQKLTEIDIKWWRNQIGLVQQDNALFNTTIYKNIEFGLIGTQWEHEHDDVKAKLIKEACRNAFADEFIDRLPQGYQTAVGERAMKLSGGQRQRLAIARAIVKQPKILILDEATSAIDVRSEQIVQAALDRACQGRTTVVIAHRLGTIRKADNIVVLRKGQVIQQGTHDALLADIDGPYYSLATAQKLQMEDEEDAKSVDNAQTEGSAKTEEELDWDAQTVGGTSLSEKDGCIHDFSHSKERPGSEAKGFLGQIDESDDRGSMDSALIRVVDKPKARFGSFAELLSEQTSRWKLYVLVLLASLGAGVSTPLQAYLFSELSSLFSFWGPYLIESVDYWCLMFFYLAVLVGCSYWALAWSTTTLGFGVTRTYRKEYFGNMISKSASFFDHPDHSAGTLTGRLAIDPTQLQQLLGTNMAFVLMSLFNLVGCIIISFAFGWKLTLMALGSSMPVVILAMFYRVRYEMNFESMSNAVFAESAKFASESIATIRTVSSLTMEDGISGRYENLLRDHISNAFQKARFSVLLFSFCDSVSLLSMAFVLWYGGHLLATHEYTPFQYMVVYIAVVQGGLSAGQWLSYGPNIANASAAADRILGMREGDDHDFHLTTPNTNDFTHNERGVELEFNNVYFEYPTRSVPVLKGLSLKIEKGQFAAIVGPSGSGKTTVISLLERYYSVNRGEILRNGISISNLDLSQYRSGISLVAQEPGLFSGSVRENILLGVPNDAIVPAADLHSAARDAGIHDFIASLPEGYDTPLGPNGVALSGGQKQRISIARALVRKPSLLLLDEATSSLDSETEREIQAVFDATKGTRTMVVVAHRLATVQNADVIFVMGDGRLVEQGDHASLIAQRGVYFQMCQSQALDR